MTYARYGIYFTPPPGDFASAGASWLGWDIAAGTERQSPEPELTQRPRKYGFHATMKPPFSLASGQELDDLRAGLAALCADQRPVRIEGLDISRIGSFLAFTARGDCSGLATLAARVVRDLDSFRAPPSAAELERRRQVELTPEQEKNLARWGYPHVMESFRFHMTLTGPLPRHLRERVVARARQHFARVVPEPFIVDSLTLVGESDSKFFHEIARYPLSKA